MKTIYAIAIITFLSSCSCNYHLKRAAKKCGKTSIVDTLIVRDTLTIPSVQLDTVFTPTVGDTVYLTKDRLSIKYVQLAGNKVFIEGKCDTVKIDRLIKVPCTTTVLNPIQWYQREWVLWLLIAVILALLIRIVLSRF